MSYDQWKTRSPDDDAGPMAADEMTGADYLTDQLRETQAAAKHAAEQAAKRIKELEASLEEAREYFADRMDVIDGDEDGPRPNKEMRLHSMIDETLHGIRF